jgi:hypothetical protein
MSTFKKAAGLAAGISAVTVIGVAVAQSVPPNPMRPNAPIAAGSQTVHMIPIGETGVLAEAPVVQQVATLTPQAEQAAVASQPAEQVAQAPAPAPEPAAATPAPSSEPTTMGAPPAPAEQPAAPLEPRHDRG